MDVLVKNGTLKRTLINIVFISLRFKVPTFLTVHILLHIVDVNVQFLKTVILSRDFWTGWHIV